jgi:hypothetical protein
MNCPACYFDNPRGMSFCGKCAAPLLAEALLQAGDLSAAQSAAAEAIALCRRSLRGTFEATAHGVLARALLRRDGPTAREAPKPRSPTRPH